MFRFISKNKGILFLAVIVLASFLWMTSQVRGSGEGGLLQRAVSAAGYPVAKAIDKAAGAVKGVWRGYFYLVGLRDENTRLKEQSEKLSFENTRLRDMLASEMRVRDLGQLREELNLPAAAARVVGRDATSWFKSAWVDEGESSGVRKNMPAAVYTGVVGRVQKTLGSTSRILLITDPSSAVSCVTERTREPGILVGAGSELCRFQYVGKHADVSVGDLVVTSGLDGVFPKGMPAGEVVRASKAAQGYFQEIDVMPTADIARVEEVLIIKYEPPDTPRTEPERPAAEKGRRRP
jgi:rod shape-determining protein MreC